MIRFDDESYFTDPQDLEKKLKAIENERENKKDGIGNKESYDAFNNGIYLTNPSDLEEKPKANTVDDQDTRVKFEKYEGSDEIKEGIYFTDPRDLRERLHGNTNEHLGNRDDIISYKIYYVDDSPYLSRLCWVWRGILLVIFFGRHLKKVFIWY